MAELKIATINRRLVTLKMFFEWAVEWGYLEVGHNNLSSTMVYLRQEEKET